MKRRRTKPIFKVWSSLCFASVMALVAGADCYYNGLSLILSGIIALFFGGVTYVTLRNL